MTMLAGASLFFAQTPAPARLPARLAIYYGYPSLVNRAHGNVEKAASVFGRYDVLVLGDGMEFPDKQPGRHPEGDPAEHRKTLQIIAAIRRRSPTSRVFGYVCLGDSQSLSQDELKTRIRLWKEMGVAGIFLDEAGYDWKIVTRKRQNVAVQYIHELGLSAFPNAFYPEELFSSDNLRGKNPDRSPPLLDARDLFLLESFQVKSGAYEDLPEWQQRVGHALDYRRQYGSRIFATTTSKENESFHPEKFSYAWWSAWLYDLDGFGWGEPNFAAVSGVLPDRRCKLEDAILSLQEFSSVGSDRIRFWRQAGTSLIVVDTGNHSVRLVPFPGSVESKEVEMRLKSPQETMPLTCGYNHE